MKGPSLGLLAGGVIVGVGLLLTVVGTPNSRHAAPPSAPVAAAVPSVEGGGVALRSAAITLPDEAETLPDGPHADLVTARCTACHSAGMILAQPALSAKQWQATVTKMREAYHAPVPQSDDAAIVTYLAGLKR